jgi:hypothetical protein
MIKWQKFNLNAGRPRPYMVTRINLRNDFFISYLYEVLIEILLKFFKINLKNSLLSSG